MGGGTAGAGGGGRGGPTTGPSIGFAAGSTFGGGGGGGGGRRGAGTQPTTGRGGRGGGGGGRGGFGGEGRAGSADKAIALKNCRNVTLRDFSMHRCGHFAILATGVDNFTLDNMIFDTNRDSIDIDCCRNARLSNLTVNSPNDDGIVLKSTYALGEFRHCENITITNCLVSGFEVGSVLDATYKAVERRIPDGAGPTGRIKLGTESSGGFKNITISNIVFDHCRGLALETVDGGPLEDVSISNITMRNTSNSPIYLRLGARMRSPEGTPVGTLRRINISNIVAYNADPRFASLIMGLPGHDIEDVKLSNIRIYYIGGGTKEHAAREVPEDEQGYPEPQRHGVIPAYGFFIRHAKGIQMDNVEVSFNEDDQRPPFILDDVKGAEFNNLKAERVKDAPMFILKKVEDFTTHQVKGIVDMTKDKVTDEKF
jgi:polygalacturonase